MGHNLDYLGPHLEHLLVCIKIQSKFPNIIHKNMKNSQIIFLLVLQIKNLTGVQTDALPEYKVQEIKRSRFILLHYGIFKIGWDWLILLCTFYIAIIVPYNAAFVTSESERASIVSDVIVEMLFIIGKPYIFYLN